MRSMFVSLLLLFAACGTDAAAKGPEDAASLFRRAGEAYRRAEYPAAITAYETILTKHGESPEVLYNLGNALFKHGKLGRSILAYERALRLDPADPDTRENLAIARARTRDRVESIPLLFITDWWNSLKEYNGLGALVLYSVVLLCLSAVSGFVFLAFEGLAVRRSALLAATVLLPVFASSVFLIFDKAEDLHARRSAVVLAPEVIIRSTPDASAVDAFTVHEGLRVEIVEERKTLCRIRLADGKDGWVSRAAIERI